MTSLNERLLVRLAIVGALLSVGAFILGHWPVTNGMSLSHVNAICQGTAIYDGTLPSCTSVAYFELAHGLLMIIGLAMLLFPMLLLTIRVVILWVKS